MAARNGAIKLVAGNSNPRLAEAIASYLATPLAKAVVRRFSDMEIFVEIQENVPNSNGYPYITSNQGKKGTQRSHIHVSMTYDENWSNELVMKRTR